MKSLLVTFALLVGCTVGPQYQRPEIAVPKAFSEGAGRGPSSFEQWWTGFRDPLLDSLVVRAVEGNLDLKVSAARIREARAARGIAASARLPQVDASGGDSRAKRGNSLRAPGSAPPPTVFQAGVDPRSENDLLR